MNELKRTPLYEIHRSLNAKLVDFGGWEMPIQYPSGIIAEHLSVRTGVGLLMCVIWVSSMSRARGLMNLSMA